MALEDSWVQEDRKVCVASMESWVELGGLALSFVHVPENSDETSYFATSLTFSSAIGVWERLGLPCSFFYSGFCFLFCACPFSS